MQFKSIKSKFPIFQQKPQITGFLVLDSILSNNIIALKDSLYHLSLPFYYLLEDFQDCYFFDYWVR